MNASPTDYMPPTIQPLIADPWSDYALLDTGNGRKLERYGKIVVNRPEPQALWSPILPESEWNKANAIFTNTGGEDGDSGKWEIRGKTPESWDVSWKDITMVCRLMSFRHMGLFPEQLTHWDWVNHQVAKTSNSDNDNQLNILNLFAYTGAASLAAAAAGAQVTHLDASKKAIQWAKENQIASNMEDKPIRWICDDAKAFVARELRRGRKYDGIIMDPPKFGRGPDGERWHIEEDLVDFMKNCTELLSDHPKFMIITAYAMRLSSVSLAALMEDVTKHLGGKVEFGELLIKQEHGNRYLSTSLYARWSAE